jgi:nanoRNase/pAp phosphatase (c-di-AMP/oligoRNAs hydrolase)
MTLRRIHNTIRWSLRSKNIEWKNIIDCNILARLFNGGGHIPAAGFSIPAKGNFKQQITTIVKTINKNIKKKK